ncbi:Ig-like domain-containing protein [Clostridium frigoris]|uniref:Ig-like domain-containing protein n=1 Tax=Clostridium frigoris TaxID=205327 RepID=A0ABS6BN23_9CLOT|nr:Ig-like domain-containing protein [Clostridium frigoris]MBU3158328.1 Ig-like domain-containing protein [Clostridium frigoris]
MNKKITGSALAALIIAGSTSFTTFAAMDNGTVVIGNKAFDLAYANDLANSDEIINSITTGGMVYVKDFNGDWIDNVTGEIVKASVIPAVVYKNATGTVNFDGADVSLPDIKETSYPKIFTNITNAITNSSNVVYLTAVDQYGEAFDIVTDSTYKITATVNGMPLSQSETTLDTVNNMAQITLNKKLAENDVVVIMLQKFDKTASSTTAKVVSSISTNYTVAKDAAVAPQSILSVKASAETVSIGDAAVTLTADVRDQYNNPADLTASKIRWIVDAGGSLLDSTSDLNSGNLTVDTTGNKVNFKAIKAGTLTITAYNILNGNKATYTVEVSVTKLTAFKLTSENPDASFNNEEIKYNKITQNEGAVLTPDMLKFNITAKTSGTSAADITATASLRGGSGTDKNDIVISAKTIKPGTYEVTPYVGTTFDASTTVKANAFSVTTSVNGVATVIDPMTISTLKVNTKLAANLVIRNMHNEAIDVSGDNVTAAVYKDGVLSDNIKVEKLDKDGQVATTSPVKALRFDASAAGNYTVRISVKDAVATYDVAVRAEVTTLNSIELGNNIVDNTIISGAANPIYRVVSVKDNKGDEITPDIAAWTISTKNGANVIDSSFASIVYYKHDAKGVIVNSTIANAEGIAVKFDPSSTAVKNLATDTTLVVSASNKAINETSVIKDTLNVTVKAKSAVKSITLADTKISLIPGATVKKEIVVLDQYGKVIMDPAMVTVVNGIKATAAVSYDETSKKMYITYTGVSTGTDTIVVKSVADAAIKATINLTTGDNTNINSIAFDAYNYKVYNAAGEDNDQNVSLTYKVNGGDIDVPASAISVIADSKLVTVTKNGSIINVKAKANDATTGIGDKDAVITISLLTANGKTSSIDLTFCDDVPVATKSTVTIKDTVDENKDLDGTQLIIGRDVNGNVTQETVGQITLLGIDQYGHKDVDVTTDTTWASANEEIATVGVKTGVVTAVKPGNTTVTGFYKGSLYTIEVEVPQVN